MLQTTFRIASLALLTGTMTHAQAPAANAAPPVPIIRNTPQGSPGGGYPGGDGQKMGGMRSGRMRWEGGMGPMGMWWKNPEVVQRVGLTADQTKRMEDIFQSSRIKLIDLKANVERQEVVLEPLLDANPVDPRAATAQIGKVADARAELEKANAGMLLGIRSVLTPDQWTKLHAGMHRHGDMMRDERPGGAAGGGMASRENWPQHEGIQGTF